ncbi:MAG: hypothetical protein AB7G06_05335, partial [Bdellovibrionales bacterium]
GRAYVDLDFSVQTKRMGTEPIHFLTMLIEGMLQLGGTIARKLVFKDSAPYFMKSVVINPRARRTVKYHIVVESQKVSDELVIHDLCAYNSDKEPFIIIRGEQVRMWRSAYDA